MSEHQRSPTDATPAVAANSYYADYNATTPCLPEVAMAVAELLHSPLGNPSSRHHIPGRRAHALLDRARQSVAALLTAHEDEIVFTSGATEALNTAIFGVMGRQLAQRPGLVVLGDEHEAVRQAAERCAEAGAQVTTITIDRLGQPDLEHLAAACDHGTALVCAIVANNETGVIHDIPAIAAIAHSCGAFLCCDATQAVGKMPVAVGALDCDLLACSSHKCYGPPGAGCLWIRRGLAIDPLLHGGGQESGRRSGTENLPAIHGFGLACDWLRVNGDQLRHHLADRNRELETALLAGLPGLVIFGAAEARLPGTTMIGHPDMSPGWLQRLPRVACSPGSSCASGQREPSRVLLAMGVDHALAANALRLSLGWMTTPEAVRAIAEEVITAGRALLAMTEKPPGD